MRKTIFVPVLWERKQPWYLAGGAPVPRAAWQPKGAASYASSKVNIVNPGTYDLVDGAAFPTWDAVNGWTFASAFLRYLTIPSALASAVPLTMVCRFNISADVNSWLMSICDTGAQAYFGMWGGGGIAGDPVIATAYEAGAANVQTTTGFTVGAWHTGAAVFSAANARASYIDGGSKGTNATAKTPAGLDTTYIGAYHNGTSIVAYLSGNIAACALYDVALSDAQVLAIHAAMAAL